MQKVLYNGKIYIEKDQFVEALLIEDDIIIMIGSNEDVLLAAKNAVLIDCQHQTVIPGFNDSHMHLLNLALSYSQVQLNTCRSIDDIILRCQTFINENPDMVKDGLLGRGWNQDLFVDDKRIPDRHDLDKITTDIPIVLRRVCGHTLVTNTKALKLLKLTKGSMQYKGGLFSLDTDGYPNGVFAENAGDYPINLIPKLAMIQQRELLIKAMRYAVACGLTSVQSNDINDFENETELRQMIEDIYHKQQALLRYRFQVGFRDPMSFKHVLATKRYCLDTRHDWLKLGPMKMFKDGSLGARTALMRQTYRDDPGNYGIEAMSEKIMDEYCALANQYHVQMITHVIGDKAIEKTLDSYEKYSDQNNINRHSLVHCQITDLPLLKRIKAMNVCVQYQPVFLEYDLHIVNQRVSDKLVETSYAFRTLHELGGKISYGSDCPVEDCNPLLNVYCAVTRKDYDGYPSNGFVKKECVDVATAIDAYTLGSAYVEYAEKTKGRLKEGYLADLVILDQDIFTIDPNQIKDIKPVLTMVGGKIVYEK